MTKNTTPSHYDGKDSNGTASRGDYPYPASASHHAPPTDTRNATDYACHDEGTMMKPSLPGWRMPNMHRCHTAAMEHGYRIGMEYGTDDTVGLYCRDIVDNAETLIVLGYRQDIEYLASVLFAKMIADGYVPRPSTTVRERE